MGMIPTLLNIYARNQRFHHNRKSQEQERLAAEKRRAADRDEATRSSNETNFQNEIKDNTPKPNRVSRSPASPFSKFRMS